MDVDSEGEMSWLDPGPTKIFSQDRPDFQLPRNTRTTPVSAGFGSPNATTPWTGNPRPPAADNSSAVKERQTRRLQHKQKAKPSFFNKPDHKNEEVQPDRAHTNACDPSSPVKVSQSGKIKSSQPRSKPLVFLSQHAAPKSGFDKAELEISPRHRKPFDYSPFGDDFDEQPVPTGSSEAGHSDDPAQQIDDGMAMVDSLRREGRLPTSSATPSEDMPVDDSPPRKLTHAIRGRSAIAADVPPQRKKIASRKPTKTNKSNTKMKMPALDLEDEKDVEDVDVDPFDIGNIPSSKPTRVSPKIVKKATVKKAAPAKASKTQKKPATRRQKKAKEAIIKIPSDNSEDVNMNDGEGGDDDYVDKMSLPRATRGTGKRNTKARSSASSKPLKGENTQPNSPPVPNNDKTSNTRTTKKSRAPASKAADTSSDKSFTETTSVAVAKAESKKMNSPVIATSERSEESTTALQAPIVHQSRSRDVSEDMSASPKASATRAGHAREADQAEQVMTVDQAHPAVDHVTIRRIDADARVARKPTIIPFGADGPMINGRRRKNFKVADDAAENEDSGVHLESDVVVAATEPKPESASHRGDVDGRAEKNSRNKDAAASQPAIVTKTTSQPRKFEEKDLFHEATNSDTDAQTLPSPRATTDVEGENQGGVQKLFDRHTEDQDDFVAGCDDEALANDNPVALHKSPRLDGREQGVVSYASTTPDESEKQSIVHEQKTKNATQNRHPVAQASVGQETRFRPSEDARKLSTGTSRTQTHTQAVKDIYTNRGNLQPVQNNLQEGHARNMNTVHEDRDPAYIRGHQKLKRPAPPDESGKAEYLGDQRHQLPAFHQSLLGVGHHRTGAYDLRPAPLVEGSSERPVRRETVHNADTLVPPPSSGKTFCVPANCHSSDDVFGPGQTKQRIDIDPAVLERLRGRTPAKRHVETHTAKPANPEQRRTTAQAGVRPLEDMSSDRSIEEGMLRAVGISGLKRQRTTVSDRPQCKDTDLVLERASEQVEVQDRTGDAMHRIVNVSLPRQIFTWYPC